MRFVSGKSAKGFEPPILGASWIIMTQGNALRSMG
jgi:hypothetical protein